MKYFIVGLDFDGVLAHGLNVKKKYAKEWFGLELSLAETKAPGFNALMQEKGLPHNYRSLMDPVNERHILEYEMPPDCLPVLNALHRKNCRFVVISDRSDHDAIYARKFLEARCAGLIRYFHHTRYTPKDELISRLRVRLHVDDDISKLLPLTGLPAELAYYRQPENVGQEIPEALKSRILEVRSFVDVGRVVEGFLPKPL